MQMLTRLVCRSPRKGVVKKHDDRLLYSMLVYLIALCYCDCAESFIRNAAIVVAIETAISTAR